MRYIVFFLLCVLFSIVSYSQTQQICGKVLAFNQFSLNNVEISAKKSKKTVQTDSTGSFCIACENRDNLTFEAEGFEKYKRSLRDDHVISVNLVFVGGRKNFEKAVKNKHIAEKDLEYAVSNLSDANNDFSNFTDMYSLIQNKLLDVNVNGGSVYIQGNTRPVVYDVDGTVYESLPSLHPSQISSIEVLKRGATSLYGIRGQNGVLKIETRK